MAGAEVVEEPADAEAAAGEETETDAKEENAKKTSSRINIQRYKGLGEMNPEQLWETTMNPETRIMKQVNIEDAAYADSVFDMLMGGDVAPRKNFIQTHAQKVENLDV